MPNNNMEGIKWVLKEHWKCQNAETVTIFGTTTPKRRTTYSILDKLNVTSSILNY